MWGRSVLENFRGVLADDGCSGGGGGGGRGVKRRQLLLWPMMISWYCRARGWELADGMESRNTPATRGWQFLKRLVQRRKGGTPDMGRKYLSSFFGALGAVLFLPLSVFPFSRSLLTHYSWYVLGVRFIHSPPYGCPFSSPPSTHSCYGLLWYNYRKSRYALRWISRLPFTLDRILPYLEIRPSRHLMTSMPFIFTSHSCLSYSFACCPQHDYPQLRPHLVVSSGLGLSPFYPFYLLFFFSSMTLFIRQFFLTFFFVPSGFLFIFLW